MDPSPEQSQYYNAPAKGVSFFTPAQNPPAGTLVKVPDGQKEPKLFTPLKIRGMTMQNRIMVCLQKQAYLNFATLITHQVKPPLPIFL
jgi:hypothetical protein